MAPVTLTGLRRSRPPVDPSPPERRAPNDMLRSALRRADARIGRVIRKASDRPRRPPLELGRQTAAFVALGIGLLTTWALLYALVFSGIQHARSQHELYATLRGELALATAPVGPTSQGNAVALLSIPGAGLRSEVVVEGTTSSVLRLGPGHLRTTPLPGQPGVSVLFGRATTFGGPFRNIAKLHAGDVITATTDEGTFIYHVIDVRRPGDLVPPPLAAGAGRLTLATSSGGWTPSKVVYVDATLQGPPAADPGGRPTALAHTEEVMAGEATTITYVEILLWLQLLAVVVCLLTWLWQRLGRWQVWLVGTPSVIAVLWGTSGTAARLLPNLF